MTSNDYKSKHVKGQLDPPVGNGQVFCDKGGQLDLPAGNVTFFASKEVNWISLLVMSRFLHQRRSVGSPYCQKAIGNVTFFASKEVIWIPLLVMSRFLHQRTLVGSPCW